MKEIQKEQEKIKGQIEKNNQAIQQYQKANSDLYNQFVKNQGKLEILEEQAEMANKKA